MFLTIFELLQHTDKKASASIACFLAANGADLTIKNRKLQTPLDLCPDPNLCKTLIKCYNERRTDDIEVPTTAPEGGTTKNNNDVQQQQVPQNNAVQDSGNEECLLCSENKRDTVFKVVISRDLHAEYFYIKYFNFQLQPCGHVVSY